MGMQCWGPEPQELQIKYKYKTKALHFPDQQQNIN